MLEFPLECLYQLLFLFETFLKHYCIVLLCDAGSQVARRTGDCAIDNLLLSFLFLSFELVVLLAEHVHVVLQPLALLLVELHVILGIR